MKRRFQVFVSSTFEDLRAERQAAVEAILKSGHIPAGMELFTAGSESQLEVIRQWIRDSDAYMLILGTRYGSIEPKSQLSYTEVEFDYARELGKPFFSVVISDAGKDAKAKAHGMAVIEQANVPKYQNFHAKVCSHMCAFFASTQDVKLAVFETLPQIVTSEGLVGWVPASEIGPSNELGSELTRTLEANRSLKAEIEQLQRKIENASESGPSFQDLYQTLSSRKVTVPAKIISKNHEKDIEISLLRIAIAYADHLARGVDNSSQSSDLTAFLMYYVASPLASFGLAEHARVPASVHWQRLKLSKEGVRFLTKARVQAQEARSPIELPSEDGNGTQSKASGAKKAKKRAGAGKNKV